MTFVAKLAVDAGRAIDPLAQEMNPPDLLEQLIVVPCSMSRRSSLPSVEAAAGDLKRTAELAHREGLPLPGDEAELHFCSSAK